MAENESPKNWDQGAVSRKCRKLFGPEKPFLKLRPAYSVKLVFWYIVKGTKIKITTKSPSFWRHKENYVTRNAPEMFRDFRETGPFLESPKTFLARKAIRKTRTRLFCKTRIFMCCKGNKKMQSFVARDAFALKIQRQWCHPKWARNVSGLSRNGTLNGNWTLTTGTPAQGSNSCLTLNPKPKP